MRGLAIPFVLMLTFMSQGQGQTQGPSTTTKKPDVPGEITGNLNMTSSV